MDPFGLITARAVSALLLLLAAGLPLFAATAPAAGLPRPRRTTIALALAAALATLWWLAAQVAAMAALPLVALDLATIAAVAAATPLQTVVAVRLTGLALLVLALLAPLPRFVSALVGLVALSTMAFTGHAGASEGTAGLLHRLADIAHLAAAACWLGALLHFIAASLGRSADAAFEAALRRFAATGSLLVALLIASGIANSLFIAGWPPPLATRWSMLLGIKLALFTAMLAIAAGNRWLFVPALARGRPGALRIALLCEAGCGIAILGLVALLGTLDPAA